MGDSCQNKLASRKPEKYTSANPDEQMTRPGSVEQFFAITLQRHLNLPVPEELLAVETQTAMRFAGVLPGMMNIQRITPLPAVRAAGTALAKAW